MLKFLGGLILGGILAVYPALAYPEQLHNALTQIGLGSWLQGANTAGDSIAKPPAPLPIPVEVR